jgi:hypothetical protein
MKLITLSCNQCGGPLDVPEDAHFATCRFCTAQLAIEHSPTATFTRVLEALSRQTTDTARGLEVVKLQQELEQLDRAWEKSHPDAERFVKTDRGTAALGVVFLIAAAFLWIWLSWQFLASRNVEFSALLIAGGLIGVGALYSEFRKARSFWSEHAVFQHKRRQVLGRIAANLSADHIKPAISK